MKKFFICFILSISITLPLELNDYRSPANIASSATIHLKNIRTSIKVATYNLGMLSTEFVSVPYYKNRTDYIHPELTSYLEKAKPSVVFFQEVWHRYPIIEIQRAAEKVNYYPVIDIKNKIRDSITFDNSHGLQILLSGNLFSRASSYSYGFKQLNQGESYICGFGLICKRGYAFARLNINHRTFLFATFHLTPLISEVNKRKTEIREIIRHLQSEKADYIIIGADFNYSPVYGVLGKKDIMKGNSRIWEKNGQLYQEWIHLWRKSDYFCRDNWSEINPEITGFTQDRETNSIASVGNSTRLEPSQRIDQIWTCSKFFNEIEIKKANLIFTEKIVNGKNDQYELSDHYGVESQINVYSVNEDLTTRSAVVSKSKLLLK